MALAVAMFTPGLAGAEPATHPAEFGAACSFSIQEVTGAEVQKLGKGWIGQSLQAQTDTGEVYDYLRAVNCGDGRQFTISTVGDYADGARFSQSRESLSGAFFLEHQPYQSNTIVDQLRRASAGTRFDVEDDDPRLSFPFPEWKDCGCKLFYPDLAEASQ